MKMMNEQDNLVKAEAQFLRSLAGELIKRAEALEELVVVLKKEEAERKLAELPWKRAQSGKCDWVKGDTVPQEIRDLFANEKKEYVTDQYHFVMTKDGNILRFQRHEKEMVA